MDGSLSNEFAIHSTQYQFMLPYEILGYGIRKEYRIFQPDELKTKFPVAYKQLMEIKLQVRRPRNRNSILPIVTAWKTKVSCSTSTHLKS